MTRKLYRCAKNCGSIEETDSGQVPTCCGQKMVEIREEDFFGCRDCAGCSIGCAKVKEDNSEN